MASHSNTERNLPKKLNFTDYQDTKARVMIDSGQSMSALAIGVRSYIHSAQ